VLAESWEQSSDGKQVTLNLRKGVLFHDGREFTSDDVKYSLLRLRDPKVAPIVGPLANQSAWWTTAETPDKYTIVLASDTPRPGVFDFFQYFTIVDKNLMDGPDAQTKVNGTGPFMFVEWVQSDHVTMKRNPNYWRTGQPYLDGIETRLYRDAQAMVAGLEGGVLDEVDSPTLQDLVRLKGDPKYQALVVAASSQFVCFVANTTMPPMDNKQFRQAINYAIDRQRFTDTVLKGFAGEPQDLPWSPVSPAWEESKNARYTFDLDKAKSLLQAAGVPDLEFDIGYALAGFSAEYASLASILQADLATIRIKTNLKPQDNAVFTASGTGLTPTYNGLRLSAGAFANLSEASSQFTLSRTFGAQSNLAGFYDDTFKSLVQSASTEPDAAKRKAIYSQINDFLLDASYSMPICQYPDMLIMRSNVRGLGYATSLEWTLRSAWLA
jgi:peptide/nickel transport system substrate-binding protein